MGKFVTATALDVIGVWTIKTQEFSASITQCSWKSCWFLIELDDFTIFDVTFGWLVGRWFD